MMEMLVRKSCLEETYGKTFHTARSENILRPLTQENILTDFRWVKASLAMLQRLENR